MLVPGTIMLLYIEEDVYHLGGIMCHDVDYISEQITAHAQLSDAPLGYTRSSGGIHRGLESNKNPALPV